MYNKLLYKTADQLHYQREKIISALELISLYIKFIQIKHRSGRKSHPYLLQVFGPLVIKILTAINDESFLINVVRDFSSNRWFVQLPCPIHKSKNLPNFSCDIYFEE